MATENHTDPLSHNFAVGLRRVVKAQISYSDDFIAELHRGSITREEVAENIAALDRSMDVVDDCLDELHGAFRLLKAQRKKLKAARQRQPVYLTTSISMLPTEILANVFILCASGRPSEGWSATTPLLIGQVCSAWRNPVLSTPMMWTNLYVSGAFAEDPERGQYASLSPALVRHYWMPLSRPLSLSVYFENRRADELGVLANYDDGLEQVWERGYKAVVFQDGVSRWKHISFAGVLKLGHTSAVLDDFEPLSLSSSEYTSSLRGAVDHHWCSFLQRAPRLRRVKLDVLTPRGYSLPWAQLEELQWGIIDGPVDFPSFSLCVHLKTLEVTTCEFGPDFWYGDELSRWNGIPIASLPELRTLKIALVESNGGVNVILPKLQAPSLDTFALSMCEYGHDLDGAEIISFLERSQCRLQHLDLCHPKLDVESVPKLLRRIPDLKVLKLSQLSERPDVLAIFQRFFVELRLPAGETLADSLVLSLHTLHVRGGDFDVAPLIAMVDSRVRARSFPLPDSGQREASSIDQGLRNVLIECCDAGKVEAAATEWREEKVVVVVQDMDDEED